MKTCPKCETQYSDDTLSYCLQDGTPLAAPAADTPTVVLGDAETVARRPDPVRIPIDAAGDAAASQSTAAAGPQTVPERSGSNAPLIVAVTAIIMLLLFGVIGLAAFIYLRNSQQAVVQNTTPSPTSTRNMQADNTPAVNSPTARPALSATVSTPAPTTKPSPEEPQEPALSNYPDTTRLKFARGAYSTSFSGDVNPGDDRSLVLACRSGQSLSARISSAKGCVTFPSGGRTMEATTSGGDNFIVVTNRCSSVARFSISITVL